MKDIELPVLYCTESTIHQPQYLSLCPEKTFYTFPKMDFTCHITVGHLKLSNHLFEPSSELQAACLTHVRDKLNGMLIMYTIGITTYTFLLAF